MEELSSLPMDFDLDGIQNGAFLDPNTLSPNDSAYQSDFADNFIQFPTEAPSNYQPTLQQPSPTYFQSPVKLETQVELPQVTSQPQTVLISSATVPQTNSRVVYTTLPIQTNQPIIVRQSANHKKKQSSKQTNKSQVVVQKIGDQITPVVLQVHTKNFKHLINY